MGENNQAVILRKVQPDDYKLFEEWWNDYEIADDVRSTTEWVSAKTVREKFSEWDERNDDLGFGLTIQGPRGHCIGHVMVWRNSPEETDARISLFIGPYYQQHGYGSQALRLAVSEAANKLHMHTLTVRIWSFNLRARHMCESLGFVEAGRKEAALERDGRRYDAVILVGDAKRLAARIDEESRLRREGEELERQRFAAERSGLGSSHA